MKHKYLLEVTLTTDSDCFTVYNEKEFITDYELFDKVSGSKRKILKFIKAIKKQLKSTKYKVAYDKSNVPDRMKDINLRMRNALSEVYKVIDKGLFGSVPYFNEWSYGGNQYYSIKIIIN